MQNFNYHSHTYRCGHAEMNMSDEEYVKEYIKMGFKKMAFTDHCPEKNRIDKRPNMRMDYTEKDEYLRSVKNLKEKYKDKIEIKSGYEVEYLPGEEENLKELKDETDIIVLGQHFVYDDNKNIQEFHNSNFSDEDLMKYAEYVEKAMEIGLPDIIAHPDIYMLVRENFGKQEEAVARKICEASEKYSIPLEINLSRIGRYTYKKNNNLSFKEKEEELKKVEYPCKDFWKIASEYNIKVLYGIDTHFRISISRSKELIKLANEIIGEETKSKLNFIEDM